MVKIKELSLIKVIVFGFLGAGLIYAMSLGMENVVLAIVSGIFGYIAKDVRLPENKPEQITQATIDAINDEIVPEKGFVLE